MGIQRNSGGEEAALGFQDEERACKFPEQDEDPKRAPVPNSVTGAHGGGRKRRSLAARAPQLPLFWEVDHQVLPGDLGVFFKCTETFSSLFLYSATQRLRKLERTERK